MSPHRFMNPRIMSSASSCSLARSVTRLRSLSCSLVANVLQGFLDTALIKGPNEHLEGVRENILKRPFA